MNLRAQVWILIIVGLGLYWYAVATYLNYLADIYVQKGMLP